MSAAGLCGIGRSHRARHAGNEIIVSLCFGRIERLHALPDGRSARLAQGVGTRGAAAHGVVRLILAAERTHVGIRQTGKNIQFLAFQLIVGAGGIAARLGDAVKEHVAVAAQVQLAPVLREGMVILNAFRTGGIDNGGIDIVHGLAEQGGILGEAGTIHPVQRHVNPVGPILLGRVATLGAQTRNRLLEKVGRYRLLAQPLHQDEIAAHVLRFADFILIPVVAAGLLLVPVGQHAVERCLQLGTAIIFAIREGVCLGHLQHAGDVLQGRPVGAVGSLVVNVGETTVGGQLRQIALGIHVEVAQRGGDEFRQNAVGKHSINRLLVGLTAGNGSRGKRTGRPMTRSGKRHNGVCGEGKGRQRGLHGHSQKK